MGIALLAISTIDTLSQTGFHTAIIQKKQAPEANHVPVIMLTHVVREGKMNEAIKRIESLASIGGSITRIRVEYLNKN